MHVSAVGRAASAGCSRSGRPFRSAAVVRVRFPRPCQLRERLPFSARAITSGSITFHPTGDRSGPANRPATGVVDSNGQYRLSSFRAADGAVPGDYHVTIKSLASVPGIDAPDAAEVWAIPERYGGVKSSGLRATIPSDAQAPLTIDFSLTQ